ncbi:MAG: hypothetical protein RJA49_1595 [Actinomycetota bacterium]
MQVSNRRRGAIAAIAGLLTAVVAVGVTSGAVEAAPGSLSTVNACQNNANGNWADIPWTLAGSAAPNPITLGAGDITLAAGNVTGAIPAAILTAGYNLGLLTVGTNIIPTKIWIAQSATNVDTGAGVKGTLTRVVTLDLPTQLTSVITDPDGTPATGDETATPIDVNQPLPNWVVTPLGGNVDFKQATPGSIGTLPVGAGAPGAPGAPLAIKGSIFTQSLVQGGIIKVNFDCQPGTADPAIPPSVDQKTFTAATTIGSFEVGVVQAPPTAPVCTNEAVSVGVGQNATVDLTDNCTDVNEGQGGGSPFTYNIGAVSAGTLTATATPGIYTYAAPATDPGAPVVITFSATDTTALTSADATITATILANTCDATTASCDLTQIVVQPVVGTTMTMDKVPGVIIMSPVVLNGKEQVSTGALQTITVTNARGSAAAWSVTAYATDLGAAGAPTFSPLPGVTVPLCSNAGAGPFVANPALAATISSDRLCIPGDNLGWSPAAVVAHNDIPGDVAQVTAGAAMAPTPADWLAALVAAGNIHDPAVGVDGLGGLLGSKTLCSAPVNHSGGTFTCNASLYLGVPASAGAGQYTGGIVLTLA